MDSADLGIKRYIDLAFRIADSPLPDFPFDFFFQLGFVIGRCEDDVDAPCGEILPRFLHGGAILCVAEEIARAVALIDECSICAA